MHERVLCRSQSNPVQSNPREDNLSDATNLDEDCKSDCCAVVYTNLTWMLPLAGELDGMHSEKEKIVIVPGFAQSCLKNLGWVILHHASLE